MASSHRRPLRTPDRLKSPLERLYREFDWAVRTPADAIRYPLGYADPRDREVVALLAACLAYGRVSLFGPWVAWALERMGPSPHRFTLEFDAARQGDAFAGFHYRFSTRVGQDMGRQIGRLVTQKLMREANVAQAR